MKKLTIVSVLVPIRWLCFYLLLMLGEEVFACAVCGTAIEASRKAFVYSTALLTLTPLVMIGGLVYYLFRANRKHEASQSSALLSPNAEGENNLESNK